MSIIKKFEFEVEIKSPAEAFWNTVKDINIIYPKLFPEVYKSIEILEGDGKSIGSIRLITYDHDSYGVGITEKSKIEQIDEEKKCLGYLVLEGRPLKFHSYYHELFTVKEKEKENGAVVAVVVWTCTYKKKIKAFPGPEIMQDTMTHRFQTLDAYTLANYNKG